MSENVVNLPLNVKPEVTYELKANLFDEVLQNFLINLTKVVGDRFLIFSKVPLQDFVHIQGASNMLLTGKTISLLLCEKSSMKIVCGIDLRESGMNAVKQSEMLQDVFQKIQRPLFQFPFVNDISVAEISEEIKPILSSSPLSRNCPKCGREMVMRKAVKGRNAGKSFWVCREFPSCKGISRIGKF
ncbi:MAG TPA: hypothetical protein DCM54_02850 [Gammaproteobacteria bacterium]|nr:hypothetical protein [Gammaproteobacteria bacterium]